MDRWKDVPMDLPPVLQDIGLLGPLPKKHVSEHSCSSARVFFYFSSSLSSFCSLFLFDFNRINECIDVSMHIQESMSMSIVGCLVE